MIEFRLLGSVDLKGPEGTLRSVLAQPKRVALLAYLAVARPDGYHRRDKLLGLFWPESDQEHGRAALRKALYFLRQSLGEDVIVGRGDEEVGLAEGAVSCDVVAFEQALEAGELEKAVALYAGPLLDGFHVGEADEFERWLESERQRLADRYAGALESLAGQAKSAADSRGAAEWWKRLAAHDPYNTRAALRLAEALAAAGDRGNGLQYLEEHARRLSDELGIEADAELVAAIERLKGDPGRSSEGLATVAPLEKVVERGSPELHPVPARPVSLLRVLGTYAVVSLAVLVAVHIFTIQLGLPDWFFPSAVVLLLVLLPVVVATALVQGAAVTARAAGAEAVPSSTVSRWLTWRNSIVGGSLAFVLLGVAVTGYTSMRARGIGPWGTLIGQGLLEERDLIVLADFEDHTGDSTLALALTDLVRVDLEQSPAVRVADDDYVGRVLERMERDTDAALTYGLAREVAIRDGLKAVVAGEIHRVGSSYLLSLRLIAAETGETLATFRETAAHPDAIIPAINQLSRKLRERVGESLKTVRASPPLSQVRTASLEALRLYTEAGQARSRTDYELAIDHLDEAIELDTLFAAAYSSRAYYLMALLIKRAQRMADAARAYELRHRLPLKERYLLEAGYHLNFSGEVEELVSIYRALWELEPDNIRWYSNLAVAYHRIGDFARAEAMFREVLELDSLAIRWGRFARSLFNQGKFDEAWETVRLWEAKSPEGQQRIPEYRAYFASAQGDYDDARAYLRQWRDLRRESPLRQQDFYQRMGRLAQVQGRLGEAEDYFRHSMAVSAEADRPMMEYFRAAVQLAGLRLWFLGDTTRALETVANVLERYPLDSLEPPDRPYPGLAGFYALAGATGRARELLAEFDTVLPPDLFGRWWERYRHSARGALALAEGRAGEAIQEFRWVRERSCPICAFAPLGRAHELAGQPDSALAMYERYLATPFAYRLLAGYLPDHGRDAYWLPVVYERLGDLYEQHGDTAEAIYYYGKLVDLWKDADPELQPRVDAARRAIESLSRET